MFPFEKPIQLTRDICVTKKEEQTYYIKVGVCWTKSVFLPHRLNHLNRVKELH